MHPERARLNRDVGEQLVSEPHDASVHLPRVPPAAYLPGGIGTYLHHLAGLLAETGETAHVIAHRWSGAPHAREESVGGRLIVHRVALDKPVQDGSPSPGPWSDRVPRGMLASSDDRPYS